jgi:hypothetical protein
VERAGLARGAGSRIECRRVVERNHSALVGIKRLSEGGNQNGRLVVFAVILPVNFRVRYLDIAESSVLECKALIWGVHMQPIS